MVLILLKYILNIEATDELKLVYNEKSLGIYLKETDNLIQINKNTLKDMHDYLCYFK